ncbi:hypothetical protein AWJ20_878 [Sugiyamaella lignohabitans]|uniref:Sec39 domain-containing protein n=1 Tax=Sugiyamaella lignohabitans TaxID=796027 RepID=A0A167D8Q2_9ASCO|nr:uncharacterized protein AWJ20_878 [Sugiyamaella lignohabitans]ANB12619.1 hypothetical protein AWJ20_878 [Sugiyamaella lignohabitans]
MERLILAAQLASLGKLDSLRTLFASEREYFILGDPFSPHSAWSILLLLVPETTDPADYLPLVSDIRANGLEPDASIIPETGITNELVVNLPESQIQLRVSRLLSELRAQSSEFGWQTSNSHSFNGNNGIKNSNGHTEINGDGVDVNAKDDGSQLEQRFISDNVYTQWLKCRLRAIDRCCGQLDWFVPLLANAPEAVQDWYYGTANVVNQYRALYASSPDQFSLQSFEQTPPEENICHLLSSTSATRVARDFEKLVVPYISYLNAWEHSLNKWIAKQAESNLFEILVPLSEVNQSSVLETPLLAACYLHPGHGIKDFETIRNIYQGIFTSQRTSVSGDESKKLQDVEILTSPIDSYDFESLLLSPRTKPDQQSLRVLLQTVNSCEVLSSIGLPANIKYVVKMQTSSTVEEKKELALKYLDKAKRAKSWVNIKNDLKTLAASHLLDGVEDNWIESKLISEALKSNDFDFVGQNFSNHGMFVDIVLEHLYSFYDNNQMKNASHCLHLLQSTTSSKPSESKDVERASALILATREISKYEGITLSPHEIKSNAPLETIDHILSNNQISYRELQQLSKIADDLAYANQYDEVMVDSVSRQIRAMCVTYALVNDNFKVAYDYCVPEFTSYNDENKTSLIAWTSCYQVGKYVSPFWDFPPASVLDQQLNILSQTLRICPKENISSILLTWKKNNNLRQEITQDSKAHKTNHQGSSHTASSLNTDPSHSAYSSLSASRIAKAISSSAAEFTSPSNPADSSSGRRTQISNMLVSGLGWAIGANQQ